MQLPGSCKLEHKPKSKSVSIRCASASDAKKALASLERGEPSRSKPSKKGAKSSSGASTKGKTAKEKEQSGATPLLLASCVVAVIKSALKNDGRRKATKADLSRAYGICTATFQRSKSIAPGSRKLTAKGKAKDAEKREELGDDGVEQVFAELDEFIQQSKR